MKSDADLLRSYVNNRSEAAFTELVRRHITFVYSYAARRVGGDFHLAEDVTQKVFSDLARKASALTNRPTVSSWLYVSARLEELAKSIHRRT
jgi:DNA-directed RNA polymerase specialized sigma24 family protein